MSFLVKKKLDKAFLSVSAGTEVVYMSAYNYADVASSISVDIVSVTTAATPLPVPIPCGLNAYCAGYILKLRVLF